MQKLMRAVIGTNNVDNCSRICHAPSAAGLTADIRTRRRHEPSRGHRSDRLLPARRMQPDRGTPGHRRADHAARPRRRTTRRRRSPPYRRSPGSPTSTCAASPGTNVAVFNGIARVLLDEGWIDDEFLAARADGLDDLRALLVDYHAGAGRRDQRRAREALREAARLYGTADAPSIVYGLGVTEHAHGTDGVRTLANLALLTWRGRHDAGRRRQPAARAEQRAGRIGHGRTARPAARLPAGDRPGGSSSLLGRVGRRSCRPGRAYAFRTCSTPPCAATSRRCTSSARTSCRPTRTADMYVPRSTPATS